jgi:hypothetical protein
MAEISYRRHRFLPVIIQHAVWLYLRFTLSYPDVEELLAERGTRHLLRNRSVCHSRNRVRAATGERLYVVPCASSEQPRAMRPGATAGREPGGRAGMLSLEFPSHRSATPKQGQVGAEGLRQLTGAGSPLPR